MHIVCVCLALLKSGIVIPQGNFINLVDGYISQHSCEVSVKKEKKKGKNTPLDISYNVSFPCGF